MPEPTPSYLIDPTGEIGAYGADEAQGLLGAGFTPAGKQQIEDYQREQAFHAKYGTVGQKIATGAEAAGEALTLGGSDYVERALGVRPEDILARGQENPFPHGIGTAVGIALPLLTGAGEFTAPGLIARAGEAGTDATAALLGSRATMLGRITARAAASGAGSAIEGAAYGLGQVVHESALGDPNLTASHIIEEVGLSTLLGGTVGAGTGALGALAGEVPWQKIEAKLSDWAEMAETTNTLKQIAGPGRAPATLRKLFGKFGPEGTKALVQDASDMGLATIFDMPADVLDKANAKLDEIGPQIGDLLQEAQSSPKFEPISASRLMARARLEILRPLEKDIGTGPAEAQFRSWVERTEDLLDSGDPENKLDLSELHDLRKQVSKQIYGLRGDQTVSTEFKKALGDFRGLVSDELDDGVGRAGLDHASREQWKTLNRQYHVASTIADIAERGMTTKGLSGVPLSAILTGGSALVHGGPLLGAVVAGGTILAKRYGPGILAAGARAVRGMVDDGAAEGIASKTAEAIAAERAAQVAEPSLLDAAANVIRPPSAPEPTETSSLLQAATEQIRGEPSWPPLRPSPGRPAEALEQAAHPGTPVETVAALSHLERMNQRVSNRLTDHLSAILKATPRTLRGEVEAGLAGTFAKAPADALAAHERMAEKFRQLASNPELMLERINHAVADLEPHAPETANALRVALSRSVAALNHTLPPAVALAPLAKPLPLGADRIAAFNRVHEVISKPSRIVHRAAAGLATPDQFAAVGMAHPHFLAKTQAHLLSKLATHRQSIPYGSRQMISSLMGRDMDGTATPQSIQAQQSVFAMPEPHPGGVRPTSKGLGELHLSERLLTPAQASVSRGLRD